MNRFILTEREIKDINVFTLLAGVAFLCLWSEPALFLLLGWYMIWLTSPNIDPEVYSAYSSMFARVAASMLVMVSVLSVLIGTGREFPHYTFLALMSGLCYLYYDHINMTRAELYQKAVNQIICIEVETKMSLLEEEED